MQEDQASDTAPRNRTDNRRERRKAEKDRKKNNEEAKTGGRRENHEGKAGGKKMRREKKKYRTEKSVFRGRGNKEGDFYMEGWGEKGKGTKEKAAAAGGGKKKLRMRNEWAADGGKKA